MSFVLTEHPGVVAKCLAETQGTPPGAQHVGVHPQQQQPRPGAERQAEAFGGGEPHASALVGAQGSGGGAVGST